ncbi:MAG: hypothetical protein AB8W37_02265 [Arsenophonus endosymbiont of Dermacentor nuttalli]
MSQCLVPYIQQMLPPELEILLTKAIEDKLMVTDIDNTIYQDELRNRREAYLSAIQNALHNKEFTALKRLLSDDNPPPIKRSYDKLRNQLLLALQQIKQLPK